MVIVVTTGTVGGLISTKQLNSPLALRPKLTTHFAVTISSSGNRPQRYPGSRITFILEPVELAAWFFAYLIRTADFL